MKQFKDVVIGEQFVVEGGFILYKTETNAAGENSRFKCGIEVKHAPEHETYGKKEFEDKFMNGKILLED